MSDKEIDVRVTAETSGVKKGMDEAAKTVQDKSTAINNILKQKAEEAAAIARKQAADVAAAARKQADDVVKANAGMAGNITASLKSMATQFVSFYTIFGMAKGVITTASDFEQLDIQLKAVMGSAQEGERAFAWIKQFAVETPYSVESTTKAFMRLKNFGLDPMDGTLRKVADAAAKYSTGADGAERVTLALGQAWGRGKLQGQDILQLIDAGIPVYDALAKVTGKTTAEVHAMSEKWTITRDVMRDLIDELGRMSAGTADAKMNSMSGAASNMGDAFANAIDDLRKSGGFDFITQGIKGVTEVIPPIVQLFAEMGSVVGDTVKELWGTVSDAFSTIAEAINAALGQDSEPMSALEFFGNMLKVVHVAVIAFGTGLKVIFTGLKTLLAEAANLFITFGNVAWKAMHLDFSGAKAAFQQGVEDAKAIARQGAADLAEISQGARDKMDAVLLGGGAAKPDIHDNKQAPLPAGSTGTSDKSAIAAAKRAAAEQLRVERENIGAILEARLSAIDAAEAAAQHAVEMDKSNKAALLQQEIEFENQRAEAVRASLEAELELANKAKDPSEQAKLNAQIEQAENQHQANLTAIRNKAEVEEHNRAKRLASIQIKSAEESAMSRVDADQQAAEQSYALGMMNKEQLLALEADFEARRNQIKADALQARLAQVDPDNDPEKYAAIKAQIDELEMQHQLRMTEIKNQAELERNQYQLSAMNSIQSSMASNLQQLMMGQMTIANFMKATWTSVLSAITGELAKFVAKWIAQKVAMMIFGKTAALSEIATNVAKAGAGGVASMAAAPWPLNMTAPAFGAAMAAAAAAFSPAASAAGGYDIPAGANPITQLHAREMVLPAKHADVIRSMAEGGGEGGGSFAPVIQISTIDASGVRDFLMTNQAALVDALRNAHRNGMR
ncbi:MAG: tape measure protein [Thiobacillus sp.]